MTLIAVAQLPDSLRLRAILTSSCVKFGPSPPCCTIAQVIEGMNQIMICHIAWISTCKDIRKLHVGSHVR